MVVLKSSNVVSENRSQSSCESRFLKSAKLREKAGSAEAVAMIPQSKKDLRLESYYLEEG